MKSRPLSPETKAFYVASTSLATTLWIAVGPGAAGGSFGSRAAHAPNTGSAAAINTKIVRRTFQALRFAIIKPIVRHVTLITLPRDRQENWPLGLLLPARPVGFTIFPSERAPLV